MRFREYQKRTRAKVAAKDNEATKSASVNWQTVIDALNTERESIRQSARSQEARIPLKERVIEEYLEYTNDPKAPGEITTTLVLWLFDCGHIGRALELATVAIERKLATPEWLKRESIAEVVADEVLEWAENAHRANQSASPYFDNVMAMLEEHDIPDQLRANYYRLQGLIELGEHGVKINAILDKEALEAAEKWFVKSLEFGGKVNTNLTAVRKRLDKL